MVSTHDAADVADPSRHLASIWAALAEAVKSPQDALRTPTLATVDPCGAPQARTVVLRAIDVAGRELRFFGDARSPKIEQLSRDPQAALCFWDSARQVQLRVTGHCTRLHDATTIRKGWQNTPASNRTNYATMMPPGAVIPSWDAVEYAENGEENFAVLAFIADAFDWLWLDRAGHQRCRFDLSEAKASRQWIVP